MKLFTKLFCLLATFSLGAGIAKAQPIGLALGIDGSGSISSSNFALQRDAYANVLDALIPADGSVAIGVWQFASNVQEEFSFTSIDSQTDKDNLLAAINAMTQLGTLTNIAGAINTAASAMIGFGLGNLEAAIIDISTDGFATAGGNPITAANNAIASGIDRINCLGVGGAANCNFIAGAGAFSITASSFADFEDATRTKIGREISVPEPGTLLLLGASLGGWGFIRRRYRPAMAS